jgi:hypothetical protein
MELENGKFWNRVTAELISTCRKAIADVVTANLGKDLFFDDLPGRNRWHWAPASAQLAQGERLSHFI